MEKSVIDELTKEQCKEIITKIVNECTNESVLKYLLLIVHDAVK